jgi:branched-chain amino acid transport system permease protein
VGGRALGRRTIRLGTIGGSIVVYVALVGMVQQFSTVNLLSDLVTLGELLIVLVPGVLGYALARPTVLGGERTSLPPASAGIAATAAGAIAGAIAAAAVAAIRLLGTDAVREVFESANDRMLELLSFGAGSVAGPALLVATCGLAGGLGAGLGGLPSAVRRPLTIGLVTVLTVAMVQDVVRVAMSELGLATAWIFDPRFGGLTYLGGVVVWGVATAAATVAGGTAGSRGSREPAPSGPQPAGMTSRRLLLLFVVGAGLAALPLVLGSFLSVVLGRVGLFILLGLGLNIVVGFAGLLDLGYVAFFAVGAYATAVLTASEVSGSEIAVGLPLFVALPIVLAIAVITGLLIGAPVLRLRGDYLAIVTLGFGEIAQVLVTSDWLKSLVGGARGLIGIPAPELVVGSIEVSFRQPRPFYYFVLAFCLVATYVSWRLADSRIGRAWTAMREDEQVAEATGVSTVKYKLLAFATGAAIGGLAGALFAVQIGSLAPSSFDILISIQALAIVILGGMGSIPGVIVGALVLVGLPGFLSEFERYQSLIFGAALVAIMLYRPQGLLPNVRRTRELQEEERAQDEWMKELAADGEEAGVAGIAEVP